MTEITINLGEELFGFASFNDWANNAQYRFADAEVRSSDMIIKGVHGEFYPCKPDIFAKTYEPVEA